MKKLLILAITLCIAFGATACKSKEEPLTDEELARVDANYNKYINESTKYKFGKIVSVDGTEIKVVYTNTPDGYDVNGYSEDLNVDTSQLKETKEEDTIDLIGKATNILPTNVGEVTYVRIGIYEPEKYNSEINIEQGEVISVDEIK